MEPNPSNPARRPTAIASPNGSWRRDNGNWIARQDELGQSTDGISTYVQQNDGRWVRSNYANVGYSDGANWYGYPTDASIVTRSASVVPRGRKVIYGQLLWGPIYNNQTGQMVVDWGEHWEWLSDRTC